MRFFKVNKKIITDKSECFVVAEIGNNHMGNFDIAKKIIKKAHECGADAVKLQKRNNKRLFTKKMYSTIYNSENSYGKTYGQHRDFLEFNFNQYKELKSFSEDLGLIFFATPFDFESVDFLEKLNIPMYKIGSGDLTNTPLIKYINQINKPIIFSTGGGDMKDVERAHSVIKKNKNVAILQCTSSYPCLPEDINLNVIKSFRKKFPKNVIGISDHLSGISSSLAGYMLGARIVEKHFTLSRAWKGTDHSFSLEPSGLTKLISYLRQARLFTGSAKKIKSKKERAPLYKMAKKLVAAKDLKKGQILTLKDIAIKSPNDGVPPYEIDKFVGKRINKDIKYEENLNFKDIRR